LETFRNPGLGWISNNSHIYNSGGYRHGTPACDKDSDLEKTVRKVIREELKTLVK